MASDDRDEKPLIPRVVPVTAVVAAAVLAALRVAGVIGWSWTWVLSPLWGLGALLLLGVVAAVAIELITGG